MNRFSTPRPGIGHVNSHFATQRLSGFLSRGAMEKFAQRIGGDEDWPGRNRDNDGKEKRFNGEFPTLFTREITSG
jgi:hypothetical protein